MLSIVVSEDEFMDRVIAELATRDYLRAIFVVNEKRKLVGILSRVDILEWAHTRLSQISTAEGHDRRRVAQFLKEERIKEAMKPFDARFAVKPTDTLEDALERMLALNLIAVPVVDENGRIVGDLKLTEILNVVVKRISVEELCVRQ